MLITCLPGKIAARLTVLMRFLWRPGLIGGLQRVLDCAGFCSLMVIFKSLTSNERVRQRSHCASGGVATARQAV